MPATADPLSLLFASLLLLATFCIPPPPTSPQPLPFNIPYTSASFDPNSRSTRREAVDRNCVNGLEENSLDFSSGVKNMVVVPPPDDDDKSLASFTIPSSRGEV